MEYNDDSVYEIVDKYRLLMNSLQNLKEAQREKAILNFFCEHYASAKEALDFFNSAELSPNLRIKLKIGHLESELMKLGNKPVTLP